ncbi:WD repeat-containing protein 8 [Roridomyces roridus]|uniref:WD repeat-containing protein 8 n=1 Tax=Roridomyces roridus TaxID=1738132 RepID=A0AAD7BUI8_9AGAR|nr:WD repeat-containing protein 8 [Roridomyces roridus]
MDFTQLYKHSAGCISLSKGGHLVLTATQDRLVLRRTDTFQIIQTWQFDASLSPTQALVSTKGTKGGSPENLISHIGWSCDSEYVLAASVNRGVVHVYKVQGEPWTARIESGAEGLVKAEWAPDGRTVLCFSQWGLRVTVWSLVTGSATYIQFPLHPDTGYAFRAGWADTFIAERHKSKDTAGVYDTADSYKLVRHFPLPTSSLSSLASSPTGNHLAVWEGPIQPGILMACFLAVGGWDDKVSSESVPVSWPTASRFIVQTIWREPSKWQETTEGRGFLSYERLHGPHSIAIQRADQTKPNAKSGTIQLDWNKNGTLLLARFENTPTAVHIFDFPLPEQAFSPQLRAVLLHSQPVLHARWNPVRKGSLTLCCGGRSIYMWNDEWVNDKGESEEVAECIGVPAREFETRDCQWTPDGKGLVLLDKTAFCMCFEVEEEDI